MEGHSPKGPKDRTQVGPPSFPSVGGYLPLRRPGHQQGPPVQLAYDRGASQGLVGASDLPRNGRQQGPSGSRNAPPFLFWRVSFWAYCQHSNRPKPIEVAAAGALNTQAQKCPKIVEDHARIVSPGFLCAAATLDSISKPFSDSILWPCSVSSLTPQGPSRPFGLPTRWFPRTLGLKKGLSHSLGGKQFGKVQEDRPLW